MKMSRPARSSIAESIGFVQFVIELHLKVPGGCPKRKKTTKKKKKRRQVTL